MSNQEIKITAKHNLFDLKLKETLQYKDLIKLHVKKNFAIIYKQTIFGPLWLIVNPLLSSLVYTFVFGNMIGLSTGGMPYLLFYMSGTAMWALFTNCLSGTSSTFLANASIFGKVYFPRLTIPFSQGITALIKFAIQFVMLLVFYAFYCINGFNLYIGINLIFVPILIIQITVLALSLGMIISSLTVKYRDLSMAMGLFTQLLMYVTPILYALDGIDQRLVKFILLNPLTPIIHNFRASLFGAGNFMIGSWIYSLVFTIVLFFVGIILYNKAERDFIDVI